MSRFAMRDIALFRAARSPLRGTWAPMRLALTRPASASRLAERAMGPPGAALPARCAAQSCEKQGRGGHPELEHCAAQLRVLDGARAVV